MISAFKNFVATLNHLASLRGKCKALASMARVYDHPDCPERTFGFRKSHNKIALKFNSMKYFWMKEIRLI